MRLIFSQVQPALAQIFEVCKQQQFRPLIPDNADCIVVLLADEHIRFAELSVNSDSNALHGVIAGTLFGYTYSHDFIVRAMDLLQQKVHVGTFACPTHPRELQFACGLPFTDESLYNTVITMVHYLSFAMSKAYTVLDEADTLYRRHKRVELLATPN